jgi:ABC-type transport system substrate-binding protein
VDARPLIRLLALGARHAVPLTEIAVKKHGADRQERGDAIPDDIPKSQAFTIVVTGTLVAFPDPDAWLTGVYRTGGSFNVTGLSDPALDAMIDKQRSIFDQQQRKAAVQEIVRYMVDHVPSTIMSNRYYLNGVKPTIKNYAPEFYMNGRQYESIWFAA